MADRACSGAPNCEHRPPWATVFCKHQTTREISLNPLMDEEYLTVVRRVWGNTKSNFTHSLDRGPVLSLTKELAAPEPYRGFLPCLEYSVCRKKWPFSFEFFFLFILATYIHISVFRWNRKEMKTESKHHLPSKSIIKYFNVCLIVLYVYVHRHVDIFARINMYVYVCVW